MLQSYGHTLICIYTLANCETRYPGLVKMQILMIIWMPRFKSTSNFSLTPSTIAISFTLVALLDIAKLNKIGIKILSNIYVSLTCYSLTSDNFTCTIVSLTIFKFLMYKYSQQSHTGNYGIN